jgi:hypothetical protein
MEIFSYIMSVTTSQAGVEVFLAVKNIAGTGSIQFSKSSEFNRADLWIIPKSKKSREELVAQIKAVPFIRQVSVVTLSKPITNTELFEVRELFNALGLDASDVKDEELSLFLNARLQGKYTYLIDFGHKKGRAPEKIRIIRAEEHPHFSPEWLTNKGHEEEILERELTIDDVEIRSVIIESIEAEEPITPPPPPTKVTRFNNTEFDKNF